MGRSSGIWLAIVLLLSAALRAGAARVLYPADPKTRLADSIMAKAIFFAPLYEGVVDSYKAELYIKGRIHIRKQNRLLRFVPSMFRLQKGVKEYMMETYSDLNFTAPNLYDQKVKASVGTASEFWEMDDRLPEYFHVNVYAPTLLHDQLISPLAPDARKYYTYRVEEEWREGREWQYKIRFMPRSKSFQLVGGYLVVSADVWSVREVRFSGRSQLLRFNNLIRMGRVGEADEFLPVQCDVEATFRFLGNVVDGHYTARLGYKDIVQDSPEPSRGKGGSRYDLSEYYTLRCDTNAYRRDTAYFNRLRPLPLTPHEDTLYADYFLRRDTLEGKKKKPRGKRLEVWGQIGDALISRYTVDLARMGSVRCSPLINPFLLSYSSRNGLSYRQEFKYNRLFAGDRLLRIAPQLGYNFKRKEFYWSVNSDFDYWPRKRAALHIDLGNGNRIYSSDVLDDLEAMPDSLFDFNKIHLDYFKDFYFRLRHTWEVVNGLTLDVGLSIHRRTEADRSDFTIQYPGTPPSKSAGDGASGSMPVPPGFDPGVLGKFRHVYTSFAPRVSVSWSPGQYYYMDGDRKVNLHSRYPTLSVDWERGIGGVLPNSGTYERVELDVQHNLKLGPMRDLYMRLGWGKFTNQKELYFVDFAHFTRHNLPVGWNDEIGGVFQLLDGDWYNSSREYLRAHVTYEAPFLLLRHLMKYTQYVLNERLYLGALVVPHLKPYIEVGYGIGTHIFDFGVFASFANWKYQEIGCKFTFELFNR